MSARRDRVHVTTKYAARSFFLNTLFLFLLSAPATHAQTYTTRSSLKSAVDQCLVSDNTGVSCSAGGVGIEIWDTSAVTSMEDMFAGYANFNADISGWNLGNVENMDNMFTACHNFNQDISGWDVGKVTTMKALFDRAYAFNQDLSAWDTSQVTDMRSLFAEAFAFNQDISTWDVDKIFQVGMSAK